MANADTLSLTLVETTVLHTATRKPIMVRFAAPQHREAIAALTARGLLVADRDMLRISDEARAVLALTIRYSGPCCDEVADPPWSRGTRTRTGCPCGSIEERASANDCASCRFDRL